MHPPPPHHCVPPEMGKLLPEPQDTLGGVTFSHLMNEEPGPRGPREHPNPHLGLHRSVQANLAPPKLAVPLSPRHLAQGRC